MTALWLPPYLAFFAASSGYQAQIEDWRAKREASLKADNGWLTVAGLFWLHEGGNAGGNNRGAVVTLPSGLKSIGSFQFSSGRTMFVPEAGAAIYFNSTPLKGPIALKSD